MTTAVAERDSTAILERVVIGGDLKDLSPAQRVSYYRDVCESLSLNPLTRPFLYITLNGKLTLYASRDCTDQLRKRDQINIAILAREVAEGVYVVTACATTPDGRSDTSIGAVPIEGQKGEARANAMMKAETKAKRRVTLSICGLGMLDESETDSIQGARTVRVDPQTGEILEPATLPAPRIPTPAVHIPDPMSLEEALANILGCQTPEEWEAVRADLRRYKWMKDEAQTIKGALEDAMERIATAATNGQEAEDGAGEL